VQPLPSTISKPLPSNPAQYPSHYPATQHNIQVITLQPSTISQPLPSNPAQYPSHYPATQHNIQAITLQPSTISKPLPSNPAQYPSNLHQSRCDKPNYPTQQWLSSAAEQRAGNGD
jgi:hypothetical protein